MRILAITGFMTALFALAPSAEAQLGFQDQFERCRGEGTGEDLPEAEKHALQNAVSTKFNDMLAKGDVEKHSGYETAMKTVRKRYRGYCSNWVVVKKSLRKVDVPAKGAKRSPKTGKPEATVEKTLVDVVLDVNLNVARIKYDMWKLMRMAELAKFGNRLAVLLEEWSRAQKGKEEELIREKERHALRAVERVFMTYKFRRAPSRSLKTRFDAALDAGRRLSEDKEFKEAMTAELKGLGGDIVLVGSVEVEFKKALPAKGKPGQFVHEFEGVGWIEAYGGNKLEPLGRYELKRDLTSLSEDQDTAKGLVLDKAGEILTERIIDQIVAEKEEPEKTDEPALITHLVIFEKISAALRGTLLTELKAIKGVEKVSQLRFGRGVLVLRASLSVEVKRFLTDCQRAFKPMGLAVRTSEGDRTIFAR